MRNLRTRGGIALVIGATFVLALAAPAAAATDHMRPFRGQTAGTSTIQLLLQPIAACPVDSMFFVTDSGAGNLTHLGRVTTTLEHCATFQGNELRITPPGSMTIVAANGDHLTLAYTGEATIEGMPNPTAAQAILDWWVVSGTGRFASATGGGKTSLAVVYTASGASTSFDWSGEIAY